MERIRKRLNREEREEEGGEEEQKRGKEGA